MKNNIILWDCLEIMKKIKDNSIDHVICDLPYYWVVKDEWDNQWKDEKEYLEWINKIVLEYKRILKTNWNIFLFTSRQFNKHISLILDKYFIEKRIIIWVRKRSFNNTRWQALASHYEPISYYCNWDKWIFNNIKIKIDSNRPEYKTWILKDWISLWDVWNDIPALPHNSKEKVKHSTQKPIALIERLVLLWSNEDDLILDNCAWSWTLWVVCQKNNRNFIMIEKDKKSYEIAINRLKK
jgi:DNA modification methylase